MAYNRVGTPKFYIDAVLLARKLGHIESETPIGLFYLNHSKSKNIVFGEESTSFFSSIAFTTRYYINSLTHVFYLGHDMYNNNISFRLKSEEGIVDENYFAGIVPDNNGWIKKSFRAINNVDYTNLVNVFGRNSLESAPSFNIGDISAGWSYSMPHSTDLELTQSFSNESLKIQNTLGGHTLTNTGWNQLPKWGNYPQWSILEDNIAYPSRRSWNLKFSYVSDTDLTPQYYNELDVDNNNRGIFERTSVTIDDPLTGEDESSQSFSIKNEFL